MRELALADEGLAAEKAGTAPEPDDPRKPGSPAELEARSWRYAMKQAWAEFRRDECTDLAAALTYYAVLSLFPALLAVISLLGVFGEGASTTRTLLDLVERIGQRGAVDQLREPITQMTETNAAGFALAFGLAGALWSASGYVGAFGRAMNRIYEVDEGRPFWKLRPTNLAITVLTVLLAALVLLGLVVTGPFARELGETLGVGDTAVTVWDIAKWPIMLVVVVFLVAVLYHATPNVRQPKFRWLSVGAALAILVWVLASLSFGLYVANFGSYNKTYGSMAGVIIFLLWLWLTNLALLFGAEVDAELERSRQLQAGIEAEETLQLPPRDTRRSEQQAAKLQAQIDEGRELRERVSAGEQTEEVSGDGPESAPDEDREGPFRVTRSASMHEQREITMSDQHTSARSEQQKTESDRLLAIYLRDHVAGAAAGTALAARCRKNNGGTSYEADLATLERAIRDDREALLKIMSEHGIEPSRWKSVLGKVVEGAARLKSNGRLVRYSPSSRVIELEGLAAGVATKRNLWRALRSAVPEGQPADPTLEELEERATDQLRRLAPLHDRACSEAFRPATG